MKNAIIYVLSILLTIHVSYAQYRYLVFDKDQRDGVVLGDVHYKMSIVDLKAKTGAYPDLTIYNFLFKSKTPVGIQLDNKQLFQGWQESTKHLSDFPCDILICITPLTKAEFRRLDVTEKVRTGEIKLDSTEQLLKWAVPDIFYSIYAPLGIFKETKVVDLKRSDYRLVVKERGRYFLLDDATLTEAYYVASSALPPDLMTMCSLSIGSMAEPKKNYLDGLKRPFGHGKQLEGKVLKDSTVIINVGKSNGYRFDRFWTNVYSIPFTRQDHRRAMSEGWTIQDGGRS